MYLGAGKTVDALTVATAATYQGNITGNGAYHAKRWRLSIPSLTQLATHPGSMHRLDDSEFSNDIQGIVHDIYNTWLNRTDGAGGKFGVIGGVQATEDMDEYAPYQFAVSVDRDPRKDGEERRSV